MYRIALVVDESFGDRVIALAENAYVWLIESAENRRSAEKNWQGSPCDDDPLLHGVSTFKRLENENMDELILRLVDMIDEHHGEFAHDPEWSEIEVFGADLTSEVEETVSTYGIVKCERTKDGFRMTRLPPSAEPPSLPPNDPR